jgi:drug/metabolite transporter (DMT)-like permease
MTKATLGWWLGLLAVTIFALTLPMTRLAVGDVADPKLSPAFVTFGRAAVAGLLSIAWLWHLRAKAKDLTSAQASDASPRHVWRPLAVSALGTVIGFPLSLALALRDVPAAHAAVVTGLLPLATGVAAAVLMRQRAGLLFWLSAVAGALLVILYAWLEGGGRWSAGDAWLLLAVLSASVGYVSGMRASAVLGAEATISWVLVLSLPLTLPTAIWYAPTNAVPLSAWASFVYVSVGSMWLGFFAWYRALAYGGVMRVSQVQLLQPFIAMVAAWPLLGEPVTLRATGFACAIMITVFMAKRAAR